MQIKKLYPALGLVFILTGCEFKFPSILPVISSQDFSISEESSNTSQGTTTSNTSQTTSNGTSSGNTSGNSTSKTSTTSSNHSSSSNSTTTSAGNSSSSSTTNTSSETTSSSTTTSSHTTTSSGGTSASTTSQESGSGTYYNSISDSLTGTSLLNALNDLITSGGVSTSYDWSRYEAADEDPNNSNNVLLIYARTSMSKSAHVSGSNGWNREHTFPQSKLDGGGGAKSDNHIVYASDNKVNGARGNIKMGVVDDGTVVKDSLGNNTTCKKTSSLFDPHNQARGIVARSTMYAAVMYGYDPEDNFESIYTMLSWHLEFYVDSFDIKRNNVVYTNQHNRNPFVDHPEYACKIWGNTNSSTKELCGIR